MVHFANADVVVNGNHASFIVSLCRQLLLKLQGTGPVNIVPLTRSKQIFKRSYGRSLLKKEEIIN